MGRLCLATIATFSVIAGSTLSSPAIAQGSCVLQSATSTLAFCDTFNAPAGTGNRSGDLNGQVWGVSRILGDTNFGQGTANAVFPTSLLGCGGASTVLPPHDVSVCNGQLREATNDNGSVTVLAMYPKQPFDFAGRTGTIGFDVSNDTHGTHAAWPEVWLTDKPVPAPFNHFDSWIALPQHGFGVRFAAQVGPGQYGSCPNHDNTTRWTVDSAVVVRNYVYDDTNGFGTRSLKMTPLDCVTSPPDGSGVMNHVELRISQNQIDVYATDAGTMAPLKRIAVLTNANLTLTRGLLWLEDAHYNADKGGSPSQRMHTFMWDNVAFDGPFTYRDLSFDAPDANAPGRDGTINLGKTSGAGQSSSWNVLGMPSAPTAQAVRVLFNFFHQDAPTVLNLTVNGHSHVASWPYPERQGYTWRTMDVAIPLADLVPGTNAVTIGADQTVTTSNVNIVLVNVGGQAPPSAPTGLRILGWLIGPLFPGGQEDMLQRRRLSQVRD
jgi:hypothetical protein